jgi:hypothetical protein
VRTADEALREHGFSGEQLLGLSRKAANDALRRAGAHLDEHRYEELVGYLVEVGVKYAARYETGHGIAIQTFLYRRMRQRYVDWLRLTLGDSRHGASGRHPPGGRLFSFDEVRHTAVLDPGYEEVGMPLYALADELDPADAWTVVNLAGPLASGWTLTETAHAAGVSIDRAKMALDELQDALADRWPTPSSPPKRWSRAKPAKALA